MRTTNMDKINLQTHYFTNTWPEKPSRFVCEDVRKRRTDDTEALSWALFYPLHGEVSQRLKHPHRSNNDQYIIYDLQLYWNGKDYEWSRFELFISKDDKSSVLVNCYELQCGEDVMNVIVHYASVGEKDPKYIMCNGWIYKLYPQKLYMFLVGKQIRSQEDAVQMNSVIEEQYKKYKYADIRDGIRHCKESQDVCVEYAQYARDTLQGIDTQGRFNPSKEAWFTTYFLVTMISESARNFRSFIITLMALDLNLNSNSEQTKLKIILEDLPMVRGGTWINTDKRGFHGASTEVKGKKNKLKNLLDNEEEIFISWLSHSGKAKIDSKMIKHLLQLIYNKHRLNEERKILETFIRNYVYFKKEINSHTSSDLLGGRQVPSISLQSIHLSLPSLIILQSKYFHMSLMYNYLSDNIQNRYLYLHDHDSNWCGTESCSPLMPSVQTHQSFINPDVLFHQHFSTDPDHLNVVLWKTRGIIHFTDILHLNQFSKVISLKGHILTETVKQQHFLTSPQQSTGFISNTLYRTTCRTSLTLSGGLSLDIITEQRCHITALHTRWRKKIQYYTIEYSSYFSSFTPPRRWQIDTRLYGNDSSG